MPITVTPIEHDQLCHGWKWAVSDEDILASRVARMLVGQYGHVSKILAGADLQPAKTTADHVADVVAKLTLPKGKDPWHRDGLLFQSISWVAAHRVRPQFIRYPHLITAHKGFDGMQLEVDDATGIVKAVIVFEDKATDNHATMLGKAYKSIKELELGRRVSELGQDVLSILHAARVDDPELDVDAAIATIVWKQAKRYRISITVQESHEAEAARKALFAGYANAVVGGVERRRAETFLVPELRPWMDQFASRVVKAAQAMELAGV